MEAYDWLKVIRLIESSTCSKVHKLYSEKMGFINLSWRDIHETVRITDSFNSCLHAIQRFINYNK